MEPLRFNPIFRRYLWGGRRLASELGKAIGDQTCAESWEVVDRPEANSVVAFGPHSGKTLHEMLTEFGPQILGAKVHQQINQPDLPERLRGRFPLLLKFLDACKTLSVQVHPNDAAGMQKEVPDLGKTEAWYVMDAAPGSLLYSGLRQGIDREQLATAIESKTTNEALHQFQPQPGDCVFVPAGTVHAIGEGLLIAEIQQCSDTTYRLFDWNRTDKDGNERDLHIDQALAVADYQRGPVSAQPMVKTDDPRCVELVRCDKFLIRRWTLNDGSDVKIAMNDCFRLLMVVQGAIGVAGDPANEKLVKGQSMLVPADVERLSIECDTADCNVFLEISIV